MVNKTSLTEGIVERKEHGLIVLGPSNEKPSRRVLYVNSYGGSSVWEKIKAGMVPTHHLWGCLELARMGYEVAVAEPLPHFYFGRRALPHDLKLVKMAKKWLRPGDIIYCGHTLLFWLPLLKALGGLTRHLVSITYAREYLDFSRSHSGIIALTPAAADQARRLAPKVKLAHLGWGVNLMLFPKLKYDPQWFLSCGITERDHPTLCAAAAQVPSGIRVICPGLPKGLSWSSNVQLVDSGKGWSVEDKKVTFPELLHDYYAGNAASLIILKNDPTEKTAVGFTNLLEAMAMSRPVIVTRTGALPGELDVEKAGCGLHVPAENPVALSEAIKFLADNPTKAREMGERGRQLCESHYNNIRHAQELHKFFESL